MIVQWAVDSSPGHVWQAIRENELRVQVLGLRPYVYKLMSFVLASLLATAGGVVYLLLLGGATPEVTTANFTLTLLVMVVIGGTGSRWGAMIGGILYTYADHRLGDLAGSSAVSSLPSFLQHAAAAAALRPRRALHPRRLLRAGRHRAPQSRAPAARPCSDSEEALSAMKIALGVAGRRARRCC